MCACDVDQCLPLLTIPQNVVYPPRECRATVKVEYSIAYSQTYQVPVLYFQIGDLGEMNKLQFIYDHLVPGTRSKELQSVGVMGAISQTVCDQLIPSNSRPPKGLTARRTTLLPIFPASLCILVGHQKPWDP